MSTVVCYFEQHGCRHSTLFMTEYKRTNRTKKTKILRCFPHCCPEHFNRSYCGSSLGVRVEVVDSDRLDTQHQTKADTVVPSKNFSLLVFAHFEEAQDHLLTVNDLIDSDDVMSSIQTEQTPKGTWIEGTVVNESVVDTPQHKSTLFQLNSQARWYYEWESAATKAQRFTKHVLRVYIFERVRSQLRVVGLVSSSEFMVVSYRRSTNEVRAEHEAFGASRVANLSVPLNGDNCNRTSDAIAFEDKLSTTQQEQNNDSKEVFWKDRKLWECRLPDIMTSSKQLAILFRFVNHVSASPYKMCLQHLRRNFKGQFANYHSYSTEKDTGAEHHFAASLSWTFLDPLDRVSDNTHRLPSKRDTEEGSLTQLVEMCTSLVAWLTLDNANLKIYRSIFRSFSGGLLDQNKVRTGYVEAVATICNLVNRYLGYGKDPFNTLSLLCEEIVTAVFQNDHFKLLRRELLDLLSCNTMYGMQDFVAQLRAQYLLQQIYLTPEHVSRTRQLGTRISAYDGSWAFNGRKSLITPIRGSAASDVSLGSLITFMSELAWINICSVDDLSLKIGSEWNICSVQSGKLKSTGDSQSGLILKMDDRQRIFSNFPSGISSLIALGGHQFGDYCGKLISPTTIVVEMYSWSVTSIKMHQALRYNLKTEIEKILDTRHNGRSTGCLRARLAIEEGVLLTDHSNQTVNFQLMSFKQKYESVKAWNLMYEIVAVYDRIRQA